MQVLKSVIQSYTSTVIHKKTLSNYLDGFLGDIISLVDKNNSFDETNFYETFEFVKTCNRLTELKYFK